MNTFTKSFLLTTCIFSAPHIYKANAFLGDEALTGLSTIQKVSKHHGDLFPSEALVPLTGSGLEAAKAEVRAHMEHSYSVEVNALITKLSPRLELPNALVREQHIKVSTGGKAVWTNIDRNRSGLPEVSGEGVDFDWEVFPGRIEKLDEIASMGIPWLEAFMNILECNENLSGGALFTKLKAKPAEELIDYKPILMGLMATNASQETLLESSSWPLKKLEAFRQFTNYLDMETEDSIMKAFDSAAKMSEEAVAYLAGQAQRIAAMLDQTTVPTIVIAALSKLNTDQISEFLDAFEVHGPSIMVGYGTIEDIRDRSLPEQKAATMAASAMLNPSQIAAFGEVTKGSVLAKLPPYNREPYIRLLASLGAEHYDKLPHVLAYKSENGLLGRILESGEIAQLARIPHSDLPHAFPLEEHAEINSR